MLRDDDADNVNTAQSVNFIAPKSLSAWVRRTIGDEELAEAGITLRALSGAEISSRHWDVFFRFYISTSDRKWGSPYLNRKFFELLGARLGEKVVLILAAVAVAADFHKAAAQRQVERADQIG